MSEEKKSDLKATRGGFGVSKNEDQEDNYIKHPAWETFIACYHPADKDDCPEYLTNREVIDRLNSIIDYSDYSEQFLYKKMMQAGFKQLLPPPGGLFLWMIKATRPVSTATD